MVTEKGGAPLVYAFHLQGQFLDQENLKGTDIDNFSHISPFFNNSELIQYYLWSTCPGQALL